MGPRMRPGFVVSLIFNWKKQIGLLRKTATKLISQKELRKKKFQFLGCRGDMLRIYISGKKKGVGKTFTIGNLNYS